MEKKQIIYHLDPLGDLYFANKDQATAFFSFLVIWIVLIVLELALGRVAGRTGKLTTRKESPKVYWSVIAFQLALVPCAFLLVTKP